jgi:hypothetical protein
MLLSPIPFCSTCNAEKNKMKSIKKSVRRQKDAVLAVLCKSTSLTINNLKSNLESAKRSDRMGTAQLLS